MQNWGNFEASNYTLTVKPGRFTINKLKTLTVTASNYNKEYDGKSHTLEASAMVGGKLAEGITIEYNVDGSNDWTITAPSIKDVGTKTVHIRANKNGYEEATATATMTVNAAPLHVTANAGQTKAYYTDSVELKYDYTKGDLKNDEVPVFTGALACTGNTKTSPVGDDYDITQGTLALKDKDDFRAGNYNLTFTGNKFSVTESDALQLTADGETVTYDGTSHSGVVTTSGVGEGVSITLTYKYDENGTEKNLTTQPSITDVGTQTVQVTAAATGYKSVIKSYTVTVNPAPIEVKALDTSKTYGAADPKTFEYTVTTGAVNNETAKFTGNLEREIGEEAGKGTGENGTYPITKGTLALADNSDGNFKASNYNLTVDPGKFTISKRMNLL